MSLLILPDQSGGDRESRWLRFSALSGKDFADTQVRPFLVTARSPSGEESDWVLKPLSRLTGLGSTLELVAARFARLLGVRIPEFAVIEVLSETVSRLGGPARAKLAPEIGANFGSRYLPGYLDLMVPGKVPAPAREGAARIFALDVAADNADRTDLANGGRVRSNILVGNNELVAIDHQHTFAWYVMLGSPGPTWNLEMERRARREHFLRTVLTISPGVTLSDARVRLRSASPSEIAALTGQIPRQWLASGGEGCVGKVGQFLADVQRRADEIFDAIEGGSLHVS